MWKGIIQKQFKKVFCAKVFCNGVWNITDHWVKMIIKARHILSYNFEHLGIGLILVQVPKTKKPQKSIMVLGHGINLNNSNIKLKKNRLLVGVISHVTQTHQLYKATQCLVMGVSLNFKGMEVIINGQNNLIGIQCN